MSLLFLLFLQFVIMQCRTCPSNANQRPALSAAGLMFDSWPGLLAPRCERVGEEASPGLFSSAQCSVAQLRPDAVTWEKYFQRASDADIAHDILAIDQIRVYGHILGVQNVAGSLMGANIDVSDQLGPYSDIGASGPILARLRAGRRSVRWQSVGLLNRNYFASWSRLNDVRYAFNPSRREEWIRSHPKSCFWSNVAQRTTDSGTGRMLQTRWAYNQNQRLQQQRQQMFQQWQRPGDYGTGRRLQPSWADQQNRQQNRRSTWIGSPYSKRRA